jgi:hypothetical protein
VANGGAPHNLSTYTERVAHRARQLEAPSTYKWLKNSGLLDGPKRHFQACARRGRQPTGKAGQSRQQEAWPERMPPGARARAAPVAHKPSAFIRPCRSVGTLDPSRLAALLRDELAQNKTARETSRP